MNVESEIRVFFDEYEERWNTRNYKSLSELWDHDDPQPFYRPMEVDGYIGSWPDLERYWEPRPGVSYIDALSFRYTDLKIKLVVPDVAVVMSDFHWDLKLKGGDYARPMSGRDPVITVLKRKPEGWRLCAYVESCMHPAVYVRKICEMAVRPSFVDALHADGKIKQGRLNGSAFGDRWA